MHNSLMPQSDASVGEKCQIKVGESDGVTRSVIFKVFSEMPAFIDSMKTR